MTENSLAPAWTFLAFIGNDNDNCSPWCIIPMIILGHEWLKVSSKLSSFPVPYYLPKLLNKTPLTQRLMIDTKLVTRALSSVLSPILEACMMEIIFQQEQERGRNSERTELCDLWNATEVLSSSFMQISWVGSTGEKYSSIILRVRVRVTRFTWSLHRPP